MSKAEEARNASIIELRKSGMTYGVLAHQFGLTPKRVRQIVQRAERAEKRRAELVAIYGPRPDISALPDQTPIGVLELCDDNVYGWAARITQLSLSQEHPIQTLGDLRRASDAQLQKQPNIGKKMLRELRRFCPHAADDAQGCANIRNALRQALHHMRRASDALEKLESGKSDGADPTSPLFQQAGAELAKAIALVQGIQRRDG
jgi:hypothetical protein